MAGNAHAQRLFLRFPSLALVWARGLFAESLVTIAMGLTGLYEGWRLSSERLLWKDPVGPGWFLFGVSLLVICVSLVRIWSYVRTASVIAVVSEEEDAVWPGPAFRLLVVFAMYTLIAPLTGYAISTLLFFVVSLRVAGVTSWRNSVLIALLLAAAFYGFCVALDIPIP